MKIVILLILVFFSINVDANTTLDESQNKNTVRELRIASLEIEGYDIGFDSEKFEYTLLVPYDVMSLKVKPSSNIPGTVIKLSDSIFNLMREETATTLTIEDKYGNSQVYVINVKKIKQKSDNNFLSNLYVENYEINFDSNKNIYDLQIHNESKLNLKVETESSLSTYEILGNSDLKNKSKVIVRVTAKNGDVRDYVINIKTSFRLLSSLLLIVLLIVGVLIIFIIVKRKNKKVEYSINSQSKSENKENEVFHL